MLQPEDDLNLLDSDEEGLAWELGMLTYTTADALKQDDLVLVPHTEPLRQVSAGHKDILGDGDAIVVDRPLVNATATWNAGAQDRAGSAQDEGGATGAEAAKAEPGAQFGRDEEDDLSDLDLAPSHVTEAEPKLPRKPERTIFPGWE